MPKQTRTYRACCSSSAHAYKTNSKACVTTCIRVSRGAVLVPHTHTHTQCVQYTGIPRVRAVIVLPSDCHPSAHAHLCVCVCVAVLSLWCAPVWDLHGPAYQIAVRHGRGSRQRVSIHASRARARAPDAILKLICGKLGFAAWPRGAEPLPSTHTRSRMYMYVPARFGYVFMRARSRAHSLQR